MGTVHGERTVSQPICALEGSSGPPRANQGVSKAEPRDSHAVHALWVHPSTSPYPALSSEADLEPISKSQCRK